MRLSEAILLGSTVVTSASYLFNERDDSGCALGMAGVSSIPNFKVRPSYDLLTQKWPILDKLVVPPCDCKSDKIPLIGVIMHIFDCHIEDDQPTWSLEQLVDWVRSVEPAEETEAELAAPSGDIVEVPAA